MTDEALSEQINRWSRVDRGIDQIRKEVGSASTEEQFQSIGLLCREVLISLAQAVFDPARHKTLDGTTPSTTDAKRMLEAFITAELAGAANEELRHYAKSAVKLADALQHRRTAQLRDAALSLEATTSVVNLFGLLSGRSDSEAHVLASRPGRDSPEREYMVMMLAHTVDNHPLMRMADMRFKNFHFSDTRVEIVLQRGEQKVAASVERARWWHPATRSAADALVDELFLRALTLLPPIEEFEL